VVKLDNIYVKDVANINIEATDIDDILGKLFCVGIATKTYINEFICDNFKIKDRLNMQEFNKLKLEVLKI